MALRLFVSHSEKDEELVAPLTRWLQAGLGLGESEIRCTSLPDTGMDAGVYAVQELRRDLESAEAVVGLLTTNSLRSHWVQLEMGAAWLLERLHPIRGPGINPWDLPAPLSDFITIGYCETAKMQRLLERLAEQLSVEILPNCEEELDRVTRAGQELLASNSVRWFSLPPVLSAWRMDSTRFDFALRSLCTELRLPVTEARSCTTPAGVLSKDPDGLPVWAKGLWDFSKNAVNAMLSPSPKSRENELDAPPGVLPDKLISDLERALRSREGRAESVRNWFEEAREWIANNPPSAASHTHNTEARRGKEVHIAG